MEYIERRKHARVYFEEAAVPEGEVELGEGFGYEVLPCMIWGLSAGGIRLSIDGRKPVAKRQVLTLTRIDAPVLSVAAPDDLRILLQAGWSMYNEETCKTYLGCRFLQLPEEVRLFFAELLRHGIEERR